MVIDAHAHVLFAETAGACGDAGPHFNQANGTVVLKAGRYEIALTGGYTGALTSIASRIEAMNGMGVTRQILSPLPLTHFHDAPVDDAIAFCRAHNDLTAETIAAYPDRFWGVATLPMQSPDAAAQELERAVRKLGLSGAQIGSHIAGQHLSEPELAPVWDAASENKATILVHPGPTVIGDADKADPMMSPQWNLDLLVGMPSHEVLAMFHLLLGRVLDTRPNLRIVIPHGGGFAPYVKGRLAFALSRRPWGKDLLKRDFDDNWKQFFFDCLLHDQVALNYLLQSEGADRVIFGTNFAAWDQDNHMIDRVRAAGLSKADEHAVLCGNAESLFTPELR